MSGLAVVLLQAFIALWVIHHWQKRKRDQGRQLEQWFEAWRAQEQQDRDRLQEMARRAMDGEGR